MAPPATTLDAGAPCVIRGARAAAAGGTLLASGVGNERRVAVRAAFEAAGLLVDVTPGREWALLRATRATP